MFNNTLKNIPPGLIERTGVCGNWSPKDVVAHLVAWDKEAAQRIQVFLEGPAEDIEYAIDEFNAKSVAERKHTSWDLLLADLYDAQNLLRSRFELVSRTHLKLDKRFWGWLRGRTNDYEEHTNQLVSWLGRNGLGSPSVS
jgi:hypothetical protein